MGGCAKYLCRRANGNSHRLTHAFHLSLLIILQEFNSFRGVYKQYQLQDDNIDFLTKSYRFPNATS